jgi:TIR domain
MRIFLSYAREHLSEAQQVDAALEAEGHEIFFARDSISAGSQFGRAIREAVAGSDLFVFLVSPESVEPGSYCLTELGFARERWRRPADRILPVVVAPMPPESFPHDIQSLSALYPTGNLAAEVVACVEAIERKRRRARLRAAGVALAALFAVASVGAAVWRGRTTESRPFLDVVAVTDPRPAVAGMPALVEVSAHVENPLPHIDSIIGLALELDDARAEPEDDFEPILLDAHGGQNYFQWFRISPRGDSLVTPRRWRVCIRHAGVRGQTCGDWSEWDAGPLAGAAPLTAEQRGRARVVASTADGFLVGLASPHQLLVEASGGNSPRVVPLPGEPTALAVAGDRVAIGTRAPGVVVMLGPGGQRSEHRVPGGTVGGSQASTGVASVALTEREAWVITGGPDGDPAIHLLDLADGRWVTPPYADDGFKFDARGMRLRAGPSGVWAVPSATTPSSLYLLSRTRVQEIRGHDVAAVSCAGDLAPRPDSTVRLLSCEGGLLTGRPRRDGFTTVADENLRLFPFTKGDWRTEWLAVTGDTVAAAITVLRNDPERHDQVPLVSRIAWALPGSDRARIGFERDSLAVTSLAVRDTLALATVTGANGVRDLIAVPLRGR